MAIIAGTTVNWRTSPRIITIPDGVTEVTIDDLQDTLLDLEDDEEGMLWEHLRNTSGGEDLGGGVSVGITMELQNAKLSFSQHISELETGTVTSSNSNGDTLIDSSATFITNGVSPGDTIINLTDGSQATVITIDSETQITCYSLEQGTDNQFDSSDSYEILDVQDCEVTGGNLVAVDEGGSSINPIFPTFGNFVTRTSSSSATSTSQTLLEHASFGGGVTLDTSSSYTYEDTSGSVIVGTPLYPVNNTQDAATIAAERGLGKIFVKGNLTLDGSDDVTGLILRGESINLSNLTINTASTTTEAQFENFTVTGILDGENTLTNCHIQGLNYVNGQIFSCMIGPGTISLDGASDCDILNCWSGVIGTDTPVVDMGGSGQALSIRGYSGGIKIMNKTGSESVSIDLVSGQIKLDPDAVTGVTSGTIVCRGVGKVINADTNALFESGSTTLNSATIINETMNPTSVADAVWDEPVNDHQTTGSFGKLVKFIKTLILSKL